MSTTRDIEGRSASSEHLGELVGRGDEPRRVAVDAAQQCFPDRARLSLPAHPFRIEFGRVGVDVEQRSGWSEPSSRKVATAAPITPRGSGSPNVAAMETGTTRPTSPCRTGPSGVQDQCRSRSATIPGSVSIHSRRRRSAPPPDLSAKAAGTVIIAAVPTLRMNSPYCATAILFCHNRKFLGVAVCAQSCRLLTECPAMSMRPIRRRSREDIGDSSRG